MPVSSIMQVRFCYLLVGDHCYGRYRLEERREFARIRGALLRRLLAVQNLPKPSRIVPVENWCAFMMALGAAEGLSEDTSLALPRISCIGSLTRAPELIRVKHVLAFLFNEVDGFDPYLALVSSNQVFALYGELDEHCSDTEIKDGDLFVVELLESFQGNQRTCAISRLRKLPHLVVH